MTFAAFLLLWGRISDLYSAKPVFAYGFLGEYRIAKFESQTNDQASA